MSLPCEAVKLGVSSSRETILKLERGVEPGWVEIIPLNRVTFHVLMMDDLNFESHNYKEHRFTNEYSLIDTVMHLLALRIHKVRMTL